MSTVEKRDDKASKDGEPETVDPAAAAANQAYLGPQYETVDSVGTLPPAEQEWYANLAEQQAAERDAVAAVEGEDGTPKEAQPTTIEELGAGGKSSRKTDEQPKRSSS